MGLAGRRRLGTLAGLASVAMVVAACGSPGGSASGGGGNQPVRVGLVYSQSGPLASYGEQYAQGFRAGLGYATKGTNTVGGRKIEVTEQDDAGDPAKAVSAGKDLIGRGYRILAGSTASNVALAVAPLAEQNKVLFVSGPAATDGITGINRHTFRSGRQTYQDILTAASFLGDVSGKKVLVLAQDSAFGKANVAAVTAVLGGHGATVTEKLASPEATDLTPFASQARGAHPDLTFVAWAGQTAPAMWQALDQQGVLGSTTVVTGLDQRASWPLFGAAAGKVSFLAHFFDGAADTPAATAMRDAVTGAGGKVDLFTVDGFTAAQMVVRAVREGDDDVDAMIRALEGWSFDGVKGGLTVRADDHALLQPMFQATMSGSGDNAAPRLVKTLPVDQAAPPVVPMRTG